MDLTELPELKPVNPGLAERTEEDVARFNDNRRELDLDNFSAEQLQEVLDWATSAKAKLTATLAGLEKQLANEWFAKEAVLDKMIGESR